MIDITEDDKFVSVELVAGEGVAPPRLAGKVEIILGDFSQAFSFGDPLKEKYLQFDDTTRSLVLKPGKVSNIYTSDGAWHTPLAVTLVPVKLTGGAGGDTLKIRFTLFTKTSLPDSLKSPKYLFIQNTKIMKDESTADLKISCGEKENKKIFKVHKSFFSASSPVFRAAVESDMVEGRTKEIYIEEVDEKTIEEMISFIYTGQFTGADLNVQKVAWLADKYDLPGMMELLCYRMNGVEVVDPETIADMIITAAIHDSAALKKIAIEKLRKNKEMLRDPAFKGKFKAIVVQDLLFEIIEEIL